MVKIVSLLLKPPPSYLEAFLVPFGPISRYNIAKVGTAFAQAGYTPRYFSPPWTDDRHDYLLPSCIPSHVQYIRVGLFLKISAPTDFPL